MPNIRSNFKKLSESVSIRETSVSQKAKGTEIMKTKLAVFFSLVALAASAQTNSIHTWTLKTGAIFSGDYFSSGTQTVVIKSHGTNYFLKISELSTNDWLYFYQCKMNQRQMQLDAEAKQMVAAGLVEATAKLIRDFPEKVSSGANDAGGWMDAKFIKVDSSYLEHPEACLGFLVEDKNGDEFYDCAVEKELLVGGKFYKDNGELSDRKSNPLVGVVMGLNRGDKIRLIGKRGDLVNSSFVIGKIEMIESAVDAAAVKKGKEKMETSR
jgi:hypothetical protein